jgi:hypothetical protein
LVTPVGIPKKKVTLLLFPHPLNNYAHISMKDRNMQLPDDQDAHRKFWMPLLLNKISKNPLQVLERILMNMSFNRDQFLAKISMK